MAKPLTLFMTLKSTPAWLQLSRARRQAFIAVAVAPILARHPAVKLRFFDAEFFTGRCSDVAMWQTPDIGAYALLIDALRDTDFFAKPYFEVVDIIPALEEAYRDADAALAPAVA